MAEKAKLVSHMAVLNCIPSIGQWLDTERDTHTDRDKKEDTERKKWERDTREKEVGDQSKS